MAPAKANLEKALMVYVHSVGRNSLQVSNCYLTIGKV
jgi:hypothetical protein